MDRTENQKTNGGPKIMCRLPIDIQNKLDQEKRENIEKYLDERKGQEVIRSCR